MHETLGKRLFPCLVISLRRHSLLALLLSADFVGVVLV